MPTGNNNNKNNGNVKIGNGKEQPFVPEEIDPIEPVISQRKVRQAAPPQQITGFQPPKDYRCPVGTLEGSGLTTNPLSSGKKFEDSTKLNWKITWGKIRPKEDEH